jgi:nicotinamide-nucleotide amidase
MPDELYRLAEQLIAQLQNRQWKMTCAESCTGGWLAKSITDISGSSAIFERGYITYSNQAKTDMLGVTDETLHHFGAVSEETVREMVDGALMAAHADLAVAISGIAGPGGGSAEKPVGLVCFGWQQSGHPARSEKYLFKGDRESIRRQAVKHALELLLKIASFTH